MPFDLNSFEHYEFNFDDLLAPLIQYRNDDFFIHYIQSWSRIFHEFESRIPTELSSFLGSHNDISKVMHEYFQYEQSFSENNSHYIFHFDIEHIKHTVSNQNKQIMSTHKFLALIDKNPIDKQCFSLHPVVIVPYITETANYIVVDGNHGLATALKYKFPFIRYVLYRPNLNDFIFSIDWAFYNFYNDINNGRTITGSNETILQDKNFIKQLHSLIV